MWGRSQWALPDFIRDFQIAVGTAGLHPRLPDSSGHCRTSSASSRSQWALPDLNRELQIAASSATSRSQWALPDRNRELQIPVGTAGPQLRALPDFSHECQIAVDCRTSTRIHARYNARRDAR
eukprot:s3812_g7.t1